MLSLTEIINSPHVYIEPAARIVYYNLLFHGYTFGEHKTQAGARTLYLQCLVAVPPWQESAKGTLMDLAATSILIWTTALSFDYNLAWKFHNMGCRMAKQLGLHHLDVLASKGTKEDATIRHKRAGFWQLVLTDLFFRLCYDKGSAISAEASPQFVRLPEVVNPVSEQPRAATAVNEIIWNRTIFLVKDFFQLFDQARSSTDGLISSVFQQKVDTICDEIADMIDDWQLVSRNPGLAGRELISPRLHSWELKKTSPWRAGATPTPLSEPLPWCSKWTSYAKQAKTTLCPHGRSEQLD